MFLYLTFPESKKARPIYKKRMKMAVMVVQTVVESELKAVTGVPAAVGVSLCSINPRLWFFPRTDTDKRA